MKRVAVFIGTRPEAIKMAPVVRALRAAPGLTPVTISTGQHREMLAQALGLLEIDVDYDLGVMQPRQTLATLTARLLTAMDDTLNDAKPDLCLVQGDTTTAFAGALACFYRKIPVGHVEAGLRTGDIWAPFPEEMNRILASRLVNIHFAPTEIGRQNLLAEGVPADRVHVTGNTVIDALLFEAERQSRPDVAESLRAKIRSRVGADWPGRPYVLITGHRRENFGEGFEQICAAIGELATRFRDHLFIYPVHLNPQVNDVVRARLGAIENVRLIEPASYDEFVALLRSCVLALTDSGGVQEEAPTFGRPVLVMRDTTERPEGVAAGGVALVGTDREKIVSSVSRLLTDREAYARMANVRNPYGDGQAASRIVTAIRNMLREPASPAMALA